MNQAKNNQRDVRKPAEVSRSGKFDRFLFEKFVQWYARPITEKYKEGLETQKKFGEFYNVSEDTLTRWTKRAAFEPKVEETIRSWIKARKPDIVAAIYAGAVSKLNPLAQTLWMKAFEGFTEKAEITHTQKVEVTVRDIRFIINALPKEQQDKFYGYLSEIDVAARAFRQDGEFFNVDAPDEDAEGEVHTKADHHAQELPHFKQSNAVAVGDQRSVCGHLEWGVLPHNY